MLVLVDNVTLSILHICRQHHRRHHYYHHFHHNHHHDHHHHHRQLGQSDRTVGIVALGPTMHKRPAVSDPSIVMLSRLGVRGRPQCHLETDLIMWSGPRQTALSVSPQNANPNDIETGVVSNKMSSLIVSLVYSKLSSWDYQDQVWTSATVLHLKDRLISKSSFVGTNCFRARWLFLDSLTAKIDFHWRQHKSWQMFHSWQQLTLLMMSL